MKEIYNRQLIYMQIKYSSHYFHRGEKTDKTKSFAISIYFLLLHMLPSLHLFQCIFACFPVYMFYVGCTFYVGCIFLFKMSKFGWNWYFNAIYSRKALLRAILW